MPTEIHPEPQLVGQMKATKYTTKTIGDREAEQIVALYMGGWYPHEIAEATGRRVSQISVAIENAGYYSERHSYSAKDAERWRAMYTGEHDGIPMSFAHISRLEGRSPSTIQLAVLRRGVRDRHQAQTMVHVYERKRMEKGH